MSWKEEEKLEERRVRQRRYLPHVGEIKVCEVSGPQRRAEGVAVDG